MSYVPFLKPAIGLLCRTRKVGQGVVLGAAVAGTATTSRRAAARKRGGMGSVCKLGGTFLQEAGHCLGQHGPERGHDLLAVLVLDGRLLRGQLERGPHPL